MLAVEPSRTLLVWSKKLGKAYFSHLLVVSSCHSASWVVILFLDTVLSELLEEHKTYLLATSDYFGGSKSSK